MKFQLTVFRFVRILAEILAIFQRRIRTKKLPNVYVVHYRMFADYTIFMRVTFCAFAGGRAR